MRDLVGRNTLMVRRNNIALGNMGVVELAVVHNGTLVVVIAPLAAGTVD